MVPSCSANKQVNIIVSLRLRMQNAVPAQPCVGKLNISGSTELFTL